MTDRETLDKACALFVGQTQGDLLAREVIAIAERAIQKAALWEELADQRALEIAALSAQQDAQWEQAQAEAERVCLQGMCATPQEVTDYLREIAP